jgi:hypothetical protein
MKLRKREFGTDQIMWRAENIGRMREIPILGLNRNRNRFIYFLKVQKVGLGFESTWVD